jgi:hypothetical protein
MMSDFIYSFMACEAKLLLLHLPVAFSMARVSSIEDRSGPKTSGLLLYKGKAVETLKEIASI